MRFRSFRFFALIPFLLGAAASEAPRTVIRVLDPSGKTPMPGAEVACLDPAGPWVSVGADGQIPLEAPCARVRCRAEGYLAGEAAKRGSSADCRVVGAARVEGPVLGLAKAEGVEARLHAHGEAAPAVGEALVPSETPGAPPRLSIGPVAAGRYRLDLVRPSDGWTCHADLGPLGHGTVGIAAAWRAPVRVRGIVVTADGDPARGIEVGAFADAPDLRPAPERRRYTLPGTIGRWICAPGAASRTETAADGGFFLDADAASPLFLAAGGWNDPRGIAAASYAEAPTEPVILRLAKPVRLSARILDAEERPVPCHAAATVRDPESPWLVRLLPGASLDAPCRSDGTLVVGPFLSSAWDLFVRPRRGLPVRLRGDAPTPGTVEDLGTLTIPNGVSFEVVVTDPDGAPIEGARILGSGSAGLVFNVEAFTDAEGRAEVGGFPEGSRLLIEVTAEGFRTQKREALDLDRAPYRITLEPAFVVSGEVRGTSGEAVPGGWVRALDGDGRQLAQTSEDGAFVIPDAPIGPFRLVADATGYETTKPLELDGRAGERATGVTIEVEPRPAVRGVVVDAGGAPVGGARILAVEEHGLRELDSAHVAAEAVSDALGRFLLQGGIAPGKTLVATASGHGPGVAPAPPTEVEDEIVLTLATPASLEVLLSSSLPPTRVIEILDSRGVGRSAATAGRTRLRFDDLSPGPATASLVPGAKKDVALVERQTVTVELRDGPAVEGTVTRNGVTLPRFAVVPIALAEFGVSSRGAAETDARGRWRIENLMPGTYRFVAIGPEGRAEKQVDLPVEGTVRIDLEVVSASATVAVREAKHGKPVERAFVSLEPEGVSCTSHAWVRSYGNLFATDVDFSVSDAGCAFANTGPEGLVRLDLSTTGTHRLRAGGSRYEAFETDVRIREGDQSFTVELTEKRGSRVRVAMRTDPPGLTGTLTCVRAGMQSQTSHGGVAGTGTCDDMPAGPSEVLFRVDGVGVGRTAVDVPEEGEIEIEVRVRPCGALLVARSPASNVPPVVRDAEGTDWVEALLRTSGGSVLRSETPEEGPVWHLLYLPTGLYTVEVDGLPHGTVSIEAGSTARIR
jgi:hypothetical protein